MGPKIVIFVGAGASRGTFSESPLMVDYFDRAIECVVSELRTAKPNTNLLRIARAFMMLEVHGLFQTSNLRSTVIAGHLWDRFRRELFWLNPDNDQDFIPLLRRYLAAWKKPGIGSDGHSGQRRENLEKTFIALERMPDETLLDKRFRKEGELERSIFSLFASLYQRKTANSYGYNHLKRILKCCMKLLKDSDTALIVNFNYDSFMDHALYHMLTPPNAASLYGGILEFEIESNGIRAKTPREKHLPIQMVKPHGSITWWYSEGGITEYACSSMGANNCFYIPSFGQTCFFHRTKWYQPKRWIRPILTPPKPTKDYSGPCRDSLEAMLSGVHSVDEIWIFGWSMPETDKELVDAITAAVKDRSKPISRLRIVDTQSGQQNGLDESARSAFMPGYIESHWGGLQTWRGWA